MAARLLYLIASDADLTILMRRVRTAPHTETQVVNVKARYGKDHPRAGQLIALDTLAGYTCDVCVFSETVGTPGERQAILNLVMPG